MVAFFILNQWYMPKDFGVIALQHYLVLAVLLHRHHKSLLSDDFIPSVCKFVSVLMYLRCTERTFACTVWLMCVIISQLAFTCTSSFVTYLDWLVSLRTVWDGFVLLGTKVQRSMMTENGIAFILALVGSLVSGLHYSFTHSFLG